MIDINELLGAFHRELPQRTQVYRGAELVPMDDGSGWRVWWLAVSGREGFIGRADSVHAARELVDGLWE